MGGEPIAGKERGGGRNDEGPVAQPEIIVFQPHRPILRERPFVPSAEQPADVVAAIGGEVTAGERHTCRDVGDGPVVIADPAAAGLAVEQPVIDGIAEAGSNCRDPVIDAGDW